MMGDFGRHMAQGIIVMMVLAFIGGMVTIGVGWALWTFVLSHVHLVWR